MGESQASLATSPSELIRWMGLRLRVPKSWQMVRHGTNQEVGSLAFVDRRRERLEVHWRRCASEPDLERMVDNQKSLALEKDGEAKAAMLGGLGRYRGLAVSSRGEVTRRAVRFDAKSKLLVELVLGSAESEEVEEVFSWLCRHLEIESERSLARRWAALDVDVVVPEGYELRALDAKPCDITFQFRLADDVERGELPAELSVRRMGMADTWFAGDAKGWMVRDPDRLRYTEWSEGIWAGHPTTLGRVEPTLATVRRIFGRDERRLVRVWHCPAENALYRVACAGYRKAAVWPFDLQVHCHPQEDA